MKSFKEFLTENKIQWDGYPTIGWWKDSDPIILYHGTHKDNKQSVLKDGLNRIDPDTGMISLTLDPNTALGYASMGGGEAEFRKVGSKPKHVPVEDRIVFKFAIPKKWFLDSYDDNLIGNLHKEKEHLSNKEKYLKWSEHNADNDQQYYALTEFRFRKAIPSKFIKGYMIKNNLKESPENIPSQPLGLDLKAFSDLKRFKNVRVEEFPLMYKQNEHGYFFAIEIDGENVAFLKAKETELYGKNSIQLERTYTLKKYRNRGLMTALYYTLAIQGFTIISDKLLSPESRSIWKKLASQFKTSCFVLNIKSNEIKQLKSEYIGTENENEVFVFTRNKRSENNDVVREHFIFIDRNLYTKLGINIE